MSPNTVLFICCNAYRKYWQESRDSVRTNRLSLHLSPSLPSNASFLWMLLSRPPQSGKWQPKQIWANWNGYKALLRKTAAAVRGIVRGTNRWGGRKEHIETQKGKRRRKAQRNLHNAKWNPGEVDGMTCSWVLFPPLWYHAPRKKP